MYGSLSEGEVCLLQNKNLLFLLKVQKSNKSKKLKKTQIILCCKYDWEKFHYLLRGCSVVKSKINKGYLKKQNQTNKYKHSEHKILHIRFVLVFMYFYNYAIIQMSVILKILFSCFITLTFFKVGSRSTFQEDQTPSKF